MNAVRWGILSVSRHYSLRVHQGLIGMPCLTVAGIASRDLQKAKAEAYTLCIPKSYGSYDELLADPDIDAVFNVLPNHLHAEWTIKALQRGKHVLCEKPFAMNAAQVASMIDVAEKNKCLLMEAFMYRFHPQWVMAKNIVRAGEIGDVLAIHTFFSFNLEDPKNIRNIAETGGGALYDIGCYAVSSARFIAGSEPVRVLLQLERDKNQGTDILSSGLIVFPPYTGKDIPIHASFTVSTRSFPSQSVEIVGSGGSIKVLLPFNAYKDVGMQLEVSTSVGSRTITTDKADQYAIMFKAFSEAVLAMQSGKTSAHGMYCGLTPPSDGLANMKVLDALFLSAKTGKWQDI